MSTIANHETSIIERLLVAPESAEAILAIKFPVEDTARMQELMEKNKQGSLSDTEKEEMEAYRRTGAFLRIMQAKARLQLRKPSAEQ